jgi:benzoyl-CoA 2,3-dioxygenase component B
VERWNRALAAVGARLVLPHVGFHRAVGEFAGSHITPQGAVVSAADWEAHRHQWLPTEADRTYITSLMRPVTEPGRMAGWIAPPASGIHTKPVDFEYVRA